MQNIGFKSCLFEVSMAKSLMNMKIDVYVSEFKSIPISIYNYPCPNLCLCSRVILLLFFKRTTFRT
jgi:hypothetical protein